MSSAPILAIHPIRLTDPPSADADARAQWNWHGSWWWSPPRPITSAGDVGFCWDGEIGIRHDSWPWLGGMMFRLKKQQLWLWECLHRPQNPQNQASNRPQKSDYRKFLRFQKASKFHKKSIPSTERPLNSLGHEPPVTWRGWRGLRAAQNRIRCWHPGGLWPPAVWRRSPRCQGRLIED